MLTFQKIVLIKAVTQPVKNSHVVTFLDIHTEYLTEEQRPIVGKMLLEEAESFSKKE